MLFEASIAEHVKRYKSSGQELPLGIEILTGRLDQRRHMHLGDYTSLELSLCRATEVINNAAKDHAGLLSRKEPAITVSPEACPVGEVTGLAASALAAVGCDTPVELNGYDSRPAPFLELGRARGKQRDLANFLWVAYFNELFQAADNRNRMLLAEGATAGSGLFLQGIPSVPHFRFSSQVMQTQLKSVLGVSESG